MLMYIEGRKAEHQREEQEEDDDDDDKEEGVERVVRNGPEQPAQTAEGDRDAMWGAGGVEVPVFLLLNTL